MLLPIHDAFLIGRTPSVDTSTPSQSALCAAPTFQHALAILNMPRCSRDRIANEAVIETVLPTTRKLSLVLRTGTDAHHTTAQLRRYVGDVYSQVWDVTLGEVELPDVVIYPQNLPNAAPESWITIQPDLDGVCSLDDTVGWISETASGGRGSKFRDTNGMGGLEEHVANLNVERAQRGLDPVKPVPVRGQQTANTAATESGTVVFVDDDNEAENTSDSNAVSKSFLGGAEPDPQHVYDSVCVGGTFDGLHFGHRKLLTLAISSVTPVTGRIYVGVTEDEMLRKKTFSEYIPPCSERMQIVQSFLNRLAPGMIDRIRVCPIEDAFGPAGQKDEHFDALVLSHETLQNGHMLNEHRTNVLGLKPLKLLCTQRTEAHGMSSTALRRLRSQKYSMSE